MNENRKVPYVCIANSQTSSLCNRSIDAREYTFADAEYAMHRYGKVGSAPLEVCPDCKERYLHVEKFNVVDLTPMATRGVKGI